MNPTELPLLLRREGAVMVLSINTPGKRNAISPGLFAALVQALETARADPGVGAVVLTGADSYFCAGGDLKQLAARRLQGPAARRERLDELHNVVRRMLEFPKPLIAAVEGGAAGAGVSLALACDMCAAAHDASFTVAHVKVGLTPDGGATALLAQLLPRQLMAELCLTGDRIGAQRLHALGVINLLTEAGASEARAIELATRLSNGPELAIARIKTLCRKATSQTFAQQLDAEADFMVDAFGGAEAVDFHAEVTH